MAASFSVNFVYNNLKDRKNLAGAAVEVNVNCGLTMQKHWQMSIAFNG